MENVEEKALKTYNDNMIFLQAQHSKVFEKILILDEAINSGQYKEKYALEYIDDSFNVLELKTNTFLYENGSKTDAKESAKSINFSKTDNVFEVYKHYDIPNNFQEDLDKLDIDKHYLFTTASLINYSKKFANPHNTHLKKIHKFIFVGTGLGLHIVEIHKKIKSNLYYIIEDDLELFKFSLFVTDYASILSDGAEIIFSIFDDENEFLHKTQEFLKQSFIYNQYIKFFSNSQTNEKRLHSLHKVIVSQGYLNFDFISLLRLSIRPLEYLKNAYNIMNLNALHTKDLFGDKPVLLLGAGPSLSSNLKWIQKNQDKFIIISISTILSELEKHNIKPDIITHIHGDELALAHIQKVQNSSFFDNSIFIFSSMAFPEFTNYLPRDNVFIFEHSSEYKENFGNLFTQEIGSTNVGSTSFALLLKLKAKEIYMLGLDFALDQSSGKTHISTHEHIKSAELEEDKEIGGALDYEMGVLKIKGNFQDEVYSTILYKNQAKEIEDILDLYQTQTKREIYNLSNGAFMKNIEPLKIEGIELSRLPKIDKELFYTDFKQSLDKNSQNFLTKQEIKRVAVSIQDTKLRLEILHQFSKEKTGDIYTYHSKLLQMFQKLLTSQVASADENLSHILTLYFQFIAGYIFDIINTKEIKNPKKLMKDLNKLFVPQLSKLIDNYRVALQDYLDFCETKDI